MNFIQVWFKLDMNSRSCSYTWITSTCEMKQLPCLTKPKIEIVQCNLSDALLKSCAFPKKHIADKYQSTFLKFVIHFQEKPTNKKSHSYRSGSPASRQGFYNWLGRRQPTWRGMLCNICDFTLCELVGITRMMLEKRINITSLHPCFPVTCNIGEDEKNECQTAKKVLHFSPIPLWNWDFVRNANQITRPVMKSLVLKLFWWFCISDPNQRLEWSNANNVKSIFFCWELSPNLCSQKLCFAKITCTLSGASKFFFQPDCNRFPLTSGQLLKLFHGLFLEASIPPTLKDWEIPCRSSAETCDLKLWISNNTSFCSSNNRATSASSCWHLQPEPSWCLLDVNSPPKKEKIWKKNGERNNLQQGISKTQYEHEQKAPKITLGSMSLGP